VGVRAVGVVPTEMEAYLRMWKPIQGSDPGADRPIRGLATPVGTGERTRERALDRDERSPPARLVKNRKMKGPGITWPRWSSPG
jgi:hypothetical protein